MRNLIIITILSLLAISCTEKSDPVVDALNETSYAWHYRNIDTTRVYADSAYNLAKTNNYPSGQAEALNNIAFCEMAAMRYDNAARYLDSVNTISNNQLELLVADVQQMKLCQKQSRNQDFYSYAESAKRRLSRIHDEEFSLSDHEKQRLTYAQSEYYIVSSAYYYYVGLYKQASDQLYKIDEYGAIQRDTAQLLNYWYNIGAGGIIMGKSKRQTAQEEFGYLLETLALAQTGGYPYWQAQALQAISEHIQDPANRRQLIADNYPAMVYVNTDNMPDSLLAGNLAQRALNLFTSYGDVYQIAGAYRTLAECYWHIGDNSSALICLNRALAVISSPVVASPSPATNPRSRRGDARCSVAVPGDGSPASNPTPGTASPQTSTPSPASPRTPNSSLAPDLVASIREDLCLVYSAMDDKQHSDYNRNIYLDLQEQTRQDRLLEARAAQLDTSVRWLNIMIATVAFMIVLVIVLLIVFARMRHRSDTRFSITNLLKPLSQWQQRTEEATQQRKDHFEEIQEQADVARLHIQQNRERNLEQRAKVSLVVSIMPLIDRMRYAVRRALRSHCSVADCSVAVPGDESPRCGDAALGVESPTSPSSPASNPTPGTASPQYITELCTSINHYNDILTQWIQMRQGDLSLRIESFRLQDIFDIVAHSTMGFKMKGITLIVKPTDAVVKADKTLTLFMVNTIADNARKFTPAGGTVTISARCSVARCGDAALGVASSASLRSVAVPGDGSSTSFRSHCSVAVPGDGSSSHAAPSTPASNPTPRTASPQTSTPRTASPQTSTPGAASPQSYVEISIEDSGSGISPETQSHIFDRTYTGGHGFGLKNCKGIIEKYKKISSLFSVCEIGCESPARGVAVPGDGSSSCGVAVPGVGSSSSSRSHCSDAVPGDGSSHRSSGTRIFFRLPLGRPVRGVAVLGDESSFHPHTTPNKPNAGDGVATNSNAGGGVATNFATKLLTLLIALASLLPMAASHPSAISNPSPQEGEGHSRLSAARGGAFADSAYLSNVLGNYSNTLRYADSCRKYVSPKDTAIILDVSNETAVAALALHKWELYRKSNDVYTRLFRQASADSSLPSYVRAMQRAKTNRMVAVVLLVMMFIIIFPAYYFLYYRHKLNYKFCVQRIERMNIILLSDVSDADKLKGIEQLSDFSRFNLTPSQKEKLRDVVSRIIDALKQNIKNNDEMDTEAELAEDECRRLELDNDRLHVSNSVLDNCLSTLKHETMYYPSRIRQMISRPDVDLNAVSEVVDYYHDLYAILAEQALRQVLPQRIDHNTVDYLFTLLRRLRGDAALGVARCGDAALGVGSPTSLRGVAVPGDESSASLRGVAVPGDESPASLRGVAVPGDESSVSNPTPGTASPQSSPQTSTPGTASPRTPNYKEVLFPLPHLTLTDAQIRDLFTPDTVNLDFLLVRQIVREMGEATNLRACGVSAFRDTNGTVTVKIIMPTRYARL